MYFYFCASVINHNKRNCQNEKKMDNWLEQNFKILDKKPKLKTENLMLNTVDQN